MKIYILWCHDSLLSRKSMVRILYKRHIDHSGHIAITHQPTSIWFFYYIWLLNRLRFSRVRLSMARGRGVKTARTRASQRQQQQQQQQQQREEDERQNTILQISLSPLAPLLSPLSQSPPTTELPQDDSLDEMSKTPTELSEVTPS